MTTGLVFHERYLWHDTGHGWIVPNDGAVVQPYEHPENPETKRRMVKSIGGQSKTCSIGLSFLGSTPSPEPSQTMPATWRGPSGTRTIEPGSTCMPRGTA